MTAAGRRLAAIVRRSAALLGARRQTLAATRDELDQALADLTRLVIRCHHQEQELAALRAAFRRRADMLTRRAYWPINVTPSRPER